MIPNKKLTGERSQTDQCFRKRTLCILLLVRFKSRSWRGELDKTLCDKVCQWLATGRWFPPITPVSSTNKAERHDKTKTAPMCGFKVSSQNIMLTSVWTPTNLRIDHTVSLLMNCLSKVSLSSFRLRFSAFDNWKKTI